MYVSFTHSSASSRLATMPRVSVRSSEPYFVSVAVMALSSRCQYSAIIFSSSIGDLLSIYKFRFSRRSYGEPAKLDKKSSGR